MPKRVTHRAEVDFDLDPGVQDAGITVLAEAEQTAEGTSPYFDRVTGDADPGGPAEFDTDLYIYDHNQQRYKRLTRGMWEAVFGSGTYDNLLEHMEGELEAR
jgi:hypothetical protein